MFWWFAHFIDNSGWFTSIWWWLMFSCMLISIITFEHVQIKKKELLIFMQKIKLVYRPIRIFNISRRTIGLITWSLLSWADSGANIDHYKFPLCSILDLYASLMLSNAPKNRIVLLVLTNPFNFKRFNILPIYIYIYNSNCDLVRPKKSCYNPIKFGKRH